MKKEKVSELNLHAGHRERMRRKFTKSNGVEFSQHELLEMILYYSIPQRNTNETAHLLMREFDNSLYALLTEGNYHRFQSVSGVGDKSAVLLSLISEVFRRSLCQNKEPKFLRSRSAFCQFFLNQLGNEHTHERLMIACLSGNMQLIRCETLETGSAGSLKVHVNKIIKTVFQANCTAVVLAHNHPAGDAVPSCQDIMETKVIQERLKMMEIELLDHIIIGNGKAYSMSEHQDFQWGF